MLTVEQCLALRGAASALVDISASIFLSICPLHGGSGPFQHHAFLLVFALGIRACVASGSVRGHIPSIFYCMFCL